MTQNHQNPRVTMAEIRNRLHQLAEDHDIPELSELAELTKKNRKNPMAPKKSPQCTPEMAEEIREYKAAHPDAANHEIAHIFKVNPGRVSESLNNIR